MSESMTPESIHALSTSVARLERRCRRLAALVVGCLVVLVALIGTSFGHTQQPEYFNVSGDVSVAYGDLTIRDVEQRPRIRLYVNEDAANGGSAVFEMLDTNGKRILSMSGHAWGGSLIRVGSADQGGFTLAHEADGTEVRGSDGSVLLRLGE